MAINKNQLPESARGKKRVMNTTSPIPEANSIPLFRRE
jgi:hypothetical protein